MFSDGGVGVPLAASPPSKAKASLVRLRPASSPDTGAPAAVSALARWRAELAAGTRTVNTFDDLWRAACWDAAGCPDRAAEILGEPELRPRPSTPAVRGGTRPLAGSWERFS
jgi:hypothetical protein